MCDHQSILVVLRAQEEQFARKATQGSRGSEEGRFVLVAQEEQFVRKATQRSRREIEKKGRTGVRVAIKINLKKGL